MDQNEEEALGSVESVNASGLIARRRLLRAGLAATPVILAVSGRSAMAQGTANCATGLSPMAWSSVAPNGTCVGASHTVQGNALGRSPGLWTPNVIPIVTGAPKTFQAPMWPVNPFDQVETLVRTSLGTWEYATRAWGSYDYLKFKGVRADDPGFANGAKFNAVFGGFEPRSFSRILIDESASKNVEWHFCGAYLNVLSFGAAYAITLSELKDLYTFRTLVPGGRVLTDSQIKDFLDQTWN